MLSNILNLILTIELIKNLPVLIQGILFGIVTKLINCLTVTTPLFTGEGSFYTPELV